jgi:hypothetical protein
MRHCGAPGHDHFFAAAGNAGVEGAACSAAAVAAAGAAAGAAIEVATIVSIGITTVGVQRRT